MNKKEKDSKSRLLGMDFSDERFEGEVNPGSFSRKSGLAAKIDRFSEQDKAAPGQVVGGIVSGLSGAGCGRQLQHPLLSVMHRSA